MFYVTTSIQKRAELWERIFGTSTIPVRGKARLMCLRNHRREYEAQCYQVNTAALTRPQKQRLAASWKSTPYEEAIKRIEGGEVIPIKARGCRLIRNDNADVENGNIPVYTQRLATE